jgi:hypothetical protein
LNREAEAESESNESEGFASRTGDDGSSSSGAGKEGCDENLGEHCDIWKLLDRIVEGVRKIEFCLSWKLVMMIGLIVEVMIEIEELFKSIYTR